MSTSARTTIRWIVLGLLVLIAALQLTLWTGPGGMPDAYAPPISPPMLVPTTTSTGM